jgi:hypothetical protein
MYKCDMLHVIVWWYAPGYDICGTLAYRATSMSQCYYMYNAYSLTPAVLEYVWNDKVSTHVMSYTVLWHMLCCVLHDIHSENIPIFACRWYGLIWMCYTAYCKAMLHTCMMALELVFWLRQLAKQCQIIGDVGITHRFRSYIEVLILCTLSVTIYPQLHFTAFAISIGKWDLRC